MHSSVGMLEPANWLISQRFAIWSYSTTGSPSPEFSQTPPKPAQTEVMLCGPRTELPVALSKTWKPSLTICTYCVSPTSPFVSGGAQLQATPGYWMPLKFLSAVGMLGEVNASAAIVVCTL